MLMMMIRMTVVFLSLSTSTSRTHIYTSNYIHGCCVQCIYIMRSSLSIHLSICAIAFTSIQCLSSTLCYLGTTDGFIIYNVDPFKETFRRIFPSGGSNNVDDDDDDVNDDDESDGDDDDEGEHTRWSWW